MSHHKHIYDAYHGYSEEELRLIYAVRKQGVKQHCASQFVKALRRLANQAEWHGCITKEIAHEAAWDFGLAVHGKGTTDAQGYLIQVWEFCYDKIRHYPGHTVGDIVAKRIEQNKNRVLDFYVYDADLVCRRYFANKSLAA